MDYQEQIEEIISTAKFGDLIEFSYPIGYSHWGVYDEDGHVIHFAVADEGRMMNNVRTYVQTVLPVCGDLLIGETKIRRMPIGEVTVPKGAHVTVSNNRHAYRPSGPEDMKQRRDALLDEEFPYRLFTLNCEHFATFVRYGKAVCNQIPGRPKNKECEEATGIFEDIVTSKGIAHDLFK
ncbi:phospholipase A and acyltransferase 2-like [Centroberyx affinis]|uniref:phospholipase A and acyltransferase 2-like n=1 Tax=Centroberyx affinis TaxID=166261 RepID=UPI003A5C4EE9